MQTELEKFEIRLEIKERTEHRDALLALASIMATKPGRDLMTYLFKNLEVGELPPMNLEGNILHEKLGFLRAGNSIFKLASQAASEETALILANIEREKYELILERYRIESGKHADTDTTDS